MGSMEYRLQLKQAILEISTHIPMVISDEIRHRAQYLDSTTHIARSSSPKFDPQKNRARLRLAYLSDFAN